MDRVAQIPGGHDILCISDNSDILKPLFMFKPDIIIMDVQEGDTSNVSASA